jgi:hypothetical protein
VRTAKLDSVEIRIATISGGDRRADAYVRPAWQGIAIHRSYDNRRVWCVTHVASGRIITWCDSRRRATRVADLIAPLGDWTRSYEETLADTALHDRVGLAVYGPAEWARRKAAAAEKSEGVV